MLKVNSSYTGFPSEWKGSWSIQQPFLSDKTYCCQPSGERRSEMEGYWIWVQIGFPKLTNILNTSILWFENITLQFGGIITIQFQNMMFDIIIWFVAVLPLCAFHYICRKLIKPSRVAISQEVTHTIRSERHPCDCDLWFRYHMQCYCIGT